MWTKCPHSFYCITFSEVHLLWSNPCNQVVKMTTWSCTTEVRGRCEKINGQILSVDFLEYRGVHLPLLCTHHPRTHVHSEKPKTRYIRNPLWRWSGLGHFDPDQPVPIKFPFWELDFSCLLFLCKKDQYLVANKYQLVILTNWKAGHFISRANQ